MTYITGKSRKAQVATYRSHGPHGIVTQSIRGPIAEARALRDTTLAGCAGARLRVENFNYDLDDAYVEIALPPEKLP